VRSDLLYVPTLSRYRLAWMDLRYGAAMATVDECRTALRTVVARLAADREWVARLARLSLDRAVACHIADLDVYFHGRLQGGELIGIADGDDPRAQIRLNVKGDDLLAMVDGKLNFVGAWATGRLSVKASFGDLFKLRKLL
jgi:hypothetical protein